mmetsp:Transcript_39077/g.96884  ORF Transcript_39077/g.96884 Transcript_39077/m.96884 type:complete len:218 (-) Transcript_39077:80-733(-)
MSKPGAIVSGVRRRLGPEEEEEEDAVLAPARNPKRPKGSKQLALPRASVQIFFGVTKDTKLDCNVAMEIVRLEPSSRWGAGSSGADDASGRVMARISNLDEFKSDVVLQIRDERGNGLDLADQYDMRKNIPDLRGPSSSWPSSESSDTDSSPRGRLRQGSRWGAWGRRQGEHGSLRSCCLPMCANTLIRCSYAPSSFCSTKPAGDALTGLMPTPQNA